MLGLGEVAREVGDVVDVPLDLHRRVGDGAPAVLLDGYERVGVLVGLGGRPLLELDDDVRRVSRPRVHTREDDVGTLGRERELVLDEHLDVVESSIEQVRAKGRDAPLPRAALAGGGGVTGLDRHLFGKAVCQMVLERREPPDGGAKKWHGQVPRQHETRAGGGMSFERKPVGPL